MSSHEQNLEKIRKACILSNPSIMELKLGCRLRDKLDNTEYYFIEWHFNSCPLVLPIEAVGKHWQDDHCDWQDQAFSMGSVGKGPFDSTLETYEILGGEIQLADVLMALRNTDEYKKLEDVMRDVRVVASSGSVRHPLYWESGVLKKWDLKESLDKQTSETILFLSQLLS